MTYSERSAEIKTILDAADANGVGTTFDVRKYRYVHVRVGAANLADFTLQALGVGGLDNDPRSIPAFASAASLTNPYAPKMLVDLDSGLDVTGTLGLIFEEGVLPLGDGITEYEFNTNTLDYINFKISGYTAGDVSVHVEGFNNL